MPLTEEMTQTIAELMPDTAGDAADWVGALVDAMGPPDREIFLRKYYLMQSSREIAASLGMSVGSVNTRLCRGRERLRKELQKGGYTHA